MRKLFFFAYKWKKRGDNRASVASHFRKIESVHLHRIIWVYKACVSNGIIEKLVFVALADWQREKQVVMRKILLVIFLVVLLAVRINFCWRLCDFMFLTNVWFYNLQVGIPAPIIRGNFKDENQNGIGIPRTGIYIDGKKWNPLTNGGNTDVYFNGKRLYNNKQQPSVPVSGAPIIDRYNYIVPESTPTTTPTNRNRRANRFW